MNRRTFFTTSVTGFFSQQFFSISRWKIKLKIIIVIYLESMTLLFGSENVILQYCLKGQCLVLQCVESLSLS